LIIVPLWALPALALELPGTCQVQFTGSSTLHDFSGTGACDPFVLQAKDAVGGDYSLPDSALTVTVAGMQTDNTSRDKKMRDMFAADLFPRISGLIGGGSLGEMRRLLHEAERGGKSFPLRLRIRDIEVPIVARVSQLVDDPRELRFTLEFPVSLAAFHLEPPSVIGLIRVADEVRVKINLQLEPLPTPWRP
jgi:hypothetical protein